jgi:hypothetical protein
MGTGSITSSGMFRAGMRLEIGKEHSGLTQANVQRLMSQMRDRYPQAQFELRLIEKGNRVFLEALRQNKRTLSKDAQYRGGSPDRLQQRDHRRQAAVELLIRKGLVTHQQAGLAAGQTVSQRFGSDAKRAAYMRELTSLIGTQGWSPARAVPVQSRPAGQVGGVPAALPPRQRTVELRAPSDAAVSGGHEPPGSTGLSRMSNASSGDELYSVAASKAPTVREDMEALFAEGARPGEKSAAARRIVDQFAASQFGDEQAQELADELKARILSLTQENRRALPLSIRMLAAIPAEWQGMKPADREAQRANQLAVEAGEDVKAALVKMDGEGAISPAEGRQPHRLLDAGRMVLGEELREAIRREVDHSRLVVLNPAASGGTEVAGLLKEFATAHFQRKGETRPVVLPMNVRGGQHWVSVVAYKQESGALGFVAVDTDVNLAGLSSEMRGQVIGWADDVRRALQDPASAAPVDVSLVAGNLQDPLRGNACGPLQVDLFKRLSQADASLSVEDVARGWMTQTLAAGEKDPAAARLQLVAWRGQLFDAVAQQAANPSDGGLLNDLYSPQGRPSDDLRPYFHPDAVEARRQAQLAPQDSQRSSEPRASSSQVASAVMESPASRVRASEVEGGGSDEFPEVVIDDGADEDGDPRVLDVGAEDLESQRRSWLSNQSSSVSRQSSEDDPLNDAVDLDDQQAENLLRNLRESGLDDSRSLSSSASQGDLDRLLMTQNGRQALIYNKENK